MRSVMQVQGLNGDILKGYHEKGIPGCDAGANTDMAVEFCITTNN